MGERSWTVLQLLKETTRYFEGKGIPNPRLDAEILLAHTLNLDRVGLYLNFDRPLTREELSSYRGVVLRRAKREPIQYIIGYKEFWSLDLKVGPGVLIPRPETELLVECALRYISEREPPLSMLDIGTGCGAISIALAKEMPELRVWAVDSSVDAIRYARENIERHHVNERIKLFVGRCLEPVKEKQVSFDAIVSNPPYVRSKELSSLQPEIRDFEPIEALDGGEDGLGVIREIVSASPGYLKESGRIFIEIGDGEADRVSQLLEDTGTFKDIKILRDLAGIARVVEAEVVHG